MIRHAAALALVGALLAATDAEARRGCGSRGGPGFRGPSGRCVGYADLARTCGSPPTTRCSAEGSGSGSAVGLASSRGGKARRGRRR